MSMAEFLAIYMQWNFCLMNDGSVCTLQEGVCYWIPIQWSLYFKTTHGTKKMWSYITGGLKIKVYVTQKIAA